MAQSPTHKFGQIIGDALEAAVKPLLSRLARRHGVYLDYQHARPARNDRRKVRWTDGEGNEHDLDYVMEDGGSEQTVGNPRAFIEVAWRRYTKHSRNKAQEIQAAVLPVAQHHGQHRPFLGVILAGDFTPQSLEQLRSNGFHVVYFPYEAVVAAFAKVGIDAAFDEETPDKDVRAKVRAYEQLGSEQHGALAKALRAARRSELDGFLGSLRIALSRVVEMVYVTPLFGKTHALGTVAEAIRFLEAYSEESCEGAPFARYEVGIRYSNGDEVSGKFSDRVEAASFLRTLV